MKRFLAILLVFICSMVLTANALAATNFSYSGSQTTTMMSWSSPATSSGTRWHLTWDTVNSNVSSTKRAVIRIYAGPGDYASSLYVYNSFSTAYHSYNSGYGEGKKETYIGGRLDDRDSGTLKAYGIFYN